MERADRDSRARTKYVARSAPRNRRQQIGLAQQTSRCTEYGVSNPELLEGLRGRGAHVTPVPVYQWDFPEDKTPLRAAVNSIIARGIDVALFTTSVQVNHLFQIAEQVGRRTRSRPAWRMS